MSHKYVRDDVSHFIRLVITDPVTVDELIETVDRQLAEGTWKFGTLIDVRYLSVGSSPPDFRAFVSHLRKLVAENGVRGPMAIAARTLAGVAGGQMYSFLGDKLDTAVEIFVDLDDAENWLRQHMITSL